MNDDVIYEAKTSDFLCDVDSMLDEPLACAMNQRERPQFQSGSCTLIARWKALSEQAKTIWDTMEDNDKALILAFQEHRKAAPKSDHSSKFSVNAHMTQDTPLDAVDDVLIAMVTKHSNPAKPNSHPADVRFHQ